MLKIEFAQNVEFMDDRIRQMLSSFGEMRKRVQLASSVVDGISPLAGRITLEQFLKLESDGMSLGYLFQELGLS